MTKYNKATKNRTFHVLGYSFLLSPGSVRNAFYGSYIASVIHQNILNKFNIYN